MWKCTVCKKDNQDTVLRCQCGFDRRYDYEQFRTFARLDAQDIQKYQRMRATAQEAIKPKVEVAKIETQAKASATTPPPNSQTKASATTLPPNTQAKASATTPPPNTQAKTPTTATTKTVAQPVKASTSSTTPSKTTTTPILLEKTILPKTKLDWLTLLIGLVLVCLAIWPDNVPLVYFFTSEAFCVPLGRFLYTQDWNSIIILLAISYLLMYKTLGKIQYKKKRIDILLYFVTSILPLCYFADVVWGIIMDYLVDASIAEEILTIDNLNMSWIWLQIIIVLLAFFEDPAKTVAKRKARKMSIWPQTKLQKLVFVMGIVLIIIVVNREPLYISYMGWEDIQGWKILCIFWILLYWLGKRLRYTYKFFKVVSYVYFSSFPLLMISYAVWSSDLLRPYVGENGAGVVLSFLAGWILVFFMAVKEEQIKI